MDNSEANKSTARHDRRVAIDGALRRRIYLFRHGSVSYMGNDGSVVADTDLVKLNKKGRDQAHAMRDLFSNIEVDRAMCSGLLRTRQTGEIILGERQLLLENAPSFREIKQFSGDFSGDYDVIADVAFSHQRSTEPGASFLGGDLYVDFYRRIEDAMQRLVDDREWHNLALFAHGGTNAAILGWFTGLGLSAFGTFDQATCCLNVLDFDVDETGDVIRRSLRASNVTADDPAKGKRHCSDMETLARWMLTDSGGAL